MNRNIVKTDSAAQLLFDRYDRAGLVAGIPPRLGLLDEGVRAKLAAILENEARAMLDEKHAGYPESFENKTIIIECARGGPGRLLHAADQHLRLSVLSADVLPRDP